MLRAFQYLVHEIAADRRKAVKEFFDGIVVFKVFEQSLYRYARTFEDWRATENLGIDGDEVAGIYVGLN